MTTYGDLVGYLESRMADDDGDWKCPPDFQRKMKQMMEQACGQHRSPAAPASGGAAGEPGPGDERAKGDARAAYVARATASAVARRSLPPVFTGLSIRGHIDHTDIPDAGIRVGEIVGHRAWFAALDQQYGWVLRSMAAESRWKPGIPMTADFSIQGAGVHAWKNPGQVSSYLEGWIYMTTNPLIVIGTVALWGEVVEHEDGWRGQYGMPLSLDRIEGDHEHRDMILNMLRYRYLGSA